MPFPVESPMNGTMVRFTGTLRAKSSSTCSPATPDASMRLIRLRRLLLSALPALLVLAFGAQAASVKTAHVTAELVAEPTAFVPGTTATVALRLAIEPGWHTYWRNPGESGLPTTLAWRLPPGYAAGDILWPAPRALPAGPLVNYGYEGEVFHLVPL